MKCLDLDCRHLAVKLRNHVEFAAVNVPVREIADYVAQAVHVTLLAEQFCTLVPYTLDILYVKLLHILVSSFAPAVKQHFSRAEIRRRGYLYIVNIAGEYRNGAAACLNYGSVVGERVTARL